MVKSVSRAVASAAMLTLALPACSRLADNYEINPVMVTSDKAGNAASGMVVQADGKAVFRPFDIGSGTLPDNQCGYSKAVADENCRNRLMDHLIMLSDQRCAGHKAAIEATAAGTNFGFSAITTLLGGAGAIVTGADAARALAGAAGATSGVHANWNESIYQKNVATAIVAKIDANRKGILRDMITVRNDKGVIYTVDAMLADIYRYHDSCSFYSGLMSLSRNDAPPLTSEALRGRIASIRAEMAANEAAVKTLSDSDAAVSLKAANQALAKALAHLTIQLGVVNSGEMAQPTAVKTKVEGGTTVNTETAPAGPTSAVEGDKK